MQGQAQEVSGHCDIRSSGPTGESLQEGLLSWLKHGLGLVLTSFSDHPLITDISWHHYSVSDVSQLKLYVLRRFIFLQILNVTFWIVPHAVILTVGCSWFDVVVNVSGVIRWTIWNTVSPTHLRNVLPVKRKNESNQPVYIFDLCTLCVRPARSALPVILPGTVPTSWSFG